MSGNIKFSPEQGREMASEIIRRRDTIEGELNALSNLISGELCARGKVQQVGNMQINMNN